jgi:hypothetical protein
MSTETIKTLLAWLGLLDLIVLGGVGLLYAYAFVSWIWYWRWGKGSRS